jgi:HEPN domain-containing protein
MDRFKMGSMQLATEQEIEGLDEEFLAAGVPLRYRPLDCFKKLYGSVPDGAQRNQLFDPLIEWFLKKYGDSVRWDGVVARFPILICGAIYLAQARFVVKGEVLANFQDGIEQLSGEVAGSLSPEEKRPILEKLTLGTRGFYSLHNLIIDDAWLREEERALVRRALYDLENAAVTLKYTGDTQAASVQAHEAAEKFLKAALSRSGSTKTLKSFGHDIPKLFRALLLAEPRYSCVSLPVENLQKLAPNMELRYAHVPRSLEMAVEGFHGSLYVCGIIAQMWLFDHARGSTRSDFKECAFYVDGSNATYYCKKVTPDSVVLTHFRSSKYTGSQMADVAMDPSYSALYLEVTDRNEDAQLRGLFLLHLKNPGKKVSPEEVGLNMVHGPEGSYASIMLKAPVNGAKDRLK